MEEFALGAIESPIDLRDYGYNDLVDCADDFEVPEEFVLDYQYEILNQGGVGSCRAHVAKRMLDYIDGVPFDTYESEGYSIGFIYGHRRESDHQGSGLVARETYRNLCDYGVCDMEDFPVNEEYPFIKSTMEKYGTSNLEDKASKRKSLGYLRLYLEDVKKYIAKYKKPVDIAVNVYENFYDAKYNGGVIPAVPSGKKRGGHSMLLIGFKKDIGVLVNSHGKTGDNGIYYLDLNSSIIREFWAVEDIRNINRPIKKTYTVGWNKVTINGVDKWLYSKDAKTVCKSEWIQTSPSKWYYIKDDCSAADGEWITDAGEWYYLDKGTCEMHTGWFKDNTGVWFYLNPEVGGPIGSMVTGWLNYKGNQYYLEERSGYNKGHMYCNGTFNINGVFYDFNSDGVMTKRY